MDSSLVSRPRIAGYPDRLSYLPGETVSMAVSTSVESFAVEIARVGWQREILWQHDAIPGRLHPVPEQGSAMGCGWPESFSYTIPPGRASGYYEVVLKAVEPSTGVRIESIAFFAVRPPVGATPAGRLLLVLATNTYNAYNDFGGPSLYTGAVRTSFLRPFARGFLKKPEPHVRYPNVSDLDDPEHESFRSWADLHGLARWSGSAGWHNWERVFVAWAEREGYGVDVAVNSDLEFHPEVVGDHRLVVSVGHDEYWSSAMRDTLEHFIDHGGNVAFFSGNAVCWQVRFEDDGRTMVCYKDAYKNDPVLGTDRQHLLSTLWSSALVGRPENYLTGVSFSRGGYIRMGRAVPKASGGYTAWRPDHWAFERTGLSYGDLFGTSDATTVYEVDGCELTLSLDDGLPVPTGRDGTPADFTILATAPAQLWSSTEVPSRYRDGGPADLEATATAVFGDASPDHIARIRNNHAVMGTFSRDGTVFTAGTTDWAYGLAGRDPVVERITKNVLDRLSK